MIEARFDKLYCDINIIVPTIQNVLDKLIGTYLHLKVGTRW